MAKIPLTDLELSDDIRNSEALYVGAFMKAMEERARMEYYRLRGYAVDSGEHTITLEMQAHFNFQTRSVVVTSTPKFTPPQHVSTVKVPLPR